MMQKMSGVAVVQGYRPKMNSIGSRISPEYTRVTDVHTYAQTDRNITTMAFDRLRQAVGQKLIDSGQFPLKDNNVY